MIETVIISVLTTTVLFMIAGIVYLNRRVNSLNKEIIKYGLQNLESLATIEELNQEIDDMSMQDKDGFVKFLSDSREWAFDYIEDVQDTIGQLAKALDAGDDDKIKECYIKLIEYLPKEGSNN